METGALQTLLNQNPTQPLKTAAFRPGQIINGKILKLFPEQIAEVQIGSQKMIAQLEAPLSAHERYWFQVMPGEGKVHLKVMGASTEDGKHAESLTRILGEFSLAPTKENLELVRFFIKEQLPVNREILQQASEWLKSAEQRSVGLETIKMILTRGLPLTQATFSALYTSNKEQSLVLLLDNLMKALDLQSNSDSSIGIKTLLNEIVPSNKNIVSGMALSHLFSTWLKEDGSDGQVALELLKHFGAVSGKSSETMVLQQMLSNLQSSKVKDIPADLAHFRNVVTLIERGGSAEAKQLISNFISDKTSTIPANLSVNEMTASLKLLFENGGKETNKQEGLRAFKQLLSVFVEGVSEGDPLDKGLEVLLGGKEYLRKAGLEMLNASGQNPKDLLTDQQAELIAKAIGKAEQVLAMPETGTAMLSSAKIKGFMTALGLSYEQQLSEVFKGSSEVASEDALKPHLLRLLNENPPQPIKEAAEQLLNKITGFQLLSQEAGPIQQLLVQMPLMLGGKMNELTMQWSGKKTEDGKIDADFCRVLFYLKMEHLNDTIIDMQVQNRIMSIQVYNENPSLKKLSAQHLPLLKTKLAEIDYHLSAVNFLVPGSTAAERNHQKLSDLYSKKEYSGVDIKI
jgi:hypothetical protein